MFAYAKINADLHVIHDTYMFICSAYMYTYILFRMGIYRSMGVIIAIIINYEISGHWNLTPFHCTALFYAIWPYGHKDEIKVYCLISGYIHFASVLRSVARLLGPSAIQHPNVYGDCLEDKREYYQN